MSMCYHKVFGHDQANLVLLSVIFSIDVCQGDWCGHINKSNCDLSVISPESSEEGNEPDINAQILVKTIDLC